MASGNDNKAVPISAATSGDWRSNQYTKRVALRSPMPGNRLSWATHTFNGSTESI
jgi:hypothetical protein